MNVLHHSSNTPTHITTTLIIFAFPSQQMNHPYYHQWNKKTVSLIENGVSAQNVLKCRQLTAHTTSALRKTIPSVNCCSFSLHLCQAHLSVTWLWCVKHVGLFFTCNCRVQRSCYQSVTQQSKVWTTYIHTYTCLTALCLGLPEWAGTRKEKPIWILLKQETVSGSGIS